MRKLFLAIPLLFQITHAAFLTPHHTTSAPLTSRLSMAPRYDPKAEKWTPTKPDEEPAAGYGPVGTLLREGPPSYFKRIGNEEQYEQAVLKFMAADGCTRREAQGNMDAYMANPNDWAFQKNEEKKGVSKRDWGAEPEGGELALTVTWAFFITGLIINVLYEGFVTGGNFGTYFS